MRSQPLQQQLFVDCAIPVGVGELLTYSVPPHFQSAIQRGLRVLVPLGKRTVTAFVVAIKKSSTITPVKPIFDILDPEPIISEELLTLTEWMAEYYVVSWGEVLKAVLVQGTASGSKRVAELVGDANGAGAKPATPRQQEILHILEAEGASSVKKLQERTGIRHVHSLLNDLSRRGLISLTEELPRARVRQKVEPVVEITPEARQSWKGFIEQTHQASRKATERQRAILAYLLARPTTESVVRLSDLLKETRLTLSMIKTLSKQGILSVARREVIRVPGAEFQDASYSTQQIILNSHQRDALEAISRGVRENQFHAYLLYGVTGSGKTQVYIDAIRETLAYGKSAIVLVPEISLTPQIVQRFRFHFGDRVAVIHSRMSLGERYDAWRMARDGRCTVVIGPRSAVFAPLPNIGLIVVDEEQEASYKQFDQTPRYHARDVAVMRACFSNAAVVMGSATPSFESYANALSGKYQLLTLPERVDTAVLPEIQIVDMTEERKKIFEQYLAKRRERILQEPSTARREKASIEFGSISELLKEKIDDRLCKKEGIILLQNRRGFAPFVECPDCGYVETCDQCNISLTYHLAKKHLRCHYCGQVKQPPENCSSCHSAEIRYRGFGTQRVEEEIQSLFPHARLLRMDLDTTSQRGAHDRILRKFSDGESDILLGTQMVAKGLDFSRVTLVGVISADTQMLLPDFRAAERTFHLLTQVAGRAGRSSLPGEVIIQTYQPSHYALKHVVTHNFLSFYQEELQYRKELFYPPYARLVLLEFKGEHEPEVMNHALIMRDFLRDPAQHTRILGPAPAALSRLKGLYRWHIIIKGLKESDPSGSAIHGVLTQAIAMYKKSPLGKRGQVRLIVDIDPIGMM